MRVHALVPIGVLVGFAWIIAFANAAHRGDRARERDELVRRMCTCKDLACVTAVDREHAKLGAVDPDNTDDALAMFGAEEQYRQCRKTALSFDDVR